MSRIHKIAAGVAVWISIAFAAAVLWATYQHGPKLARAAAAALDDERPGRHVIATPEKMQRAQAAWRRRRAE